VSFSALSAGDGVVARLPWADGDGARLPWADGDCGQRAVEGVEPAPASAHRTERTGETSRELAALPRSTPMRMCRGFLCAAKVEDADAGGARPRGLSSMLSDGEEGDFGRGDSGAADIDGADGAVNPVDAEGSI
jgi:hypothetical protein